MNTTHKVIDTQVGELTLVAENGVLSGIYFPGHWTKPDPASFGAQSEHGFDEIERQLRDYLAGARTGFDLPTAAAGDAFQRRVWELIDEIPYGQTSTYGALAHEVGGPAMARRVGNAVGDNPLSIVVPCHRVVGKDGKLTGYAGGLERKQFLLELEGALLSAGAPATLFELAGSTAARQLARSGNADTGSSAQNTSTSAGSN